MKKRLFRMLLMLCLLVAALTLAASAATFSGSFYTGDPSSIDWDKAPVSVIDWESTFYCGQCKSADTAITPTPTVKLTGIEYPTGSDYRSMTLTVDISEFTCMKCKRKIGPIQDLRVTCTTTVQNGHFCHTGKRGDYLIAYGTQTIASGRIDLTINTTRKYELQKCEARGATCSQVGLKQACWHCDGCDKYFESNSQTAAEIPASDIISKTAHTYDPETGKCNVCQAQAPARLDNTIYETFTEALEAYNKNGGTLTVYSLPVGASVDLAYSGTLVVNNGAAVSKITMSDGLEVTIENAGTISSIEMSESSTVTIKNGSSGEIGSIGMNQPGTLDINNIGKIGSIGMNQPGTLTIDNSGTVDLLKTSVNMTGDGTRTINVTNRGTITCLEAPNTWITVQNDSEIGELIGYFYPDDDNTSRDNMVTLARGSGIYKKISSVKPDPFVNSRWTSATADFSKLLLTTDDYFYFVTPGKISGEYKYWYRDGFRLSESTNTLTDVYFTCYPFSSIEVTGKAGNSAPVELPGENGRLTMTVDAGQDVTLTGAVVLPEHGLNSKEDQLTYRWNCNAPGGRESGNVFTFEDILYGEYDLTLTVQDNEYHHSKKIYIHIKAEKPEGEKIKIFLREPTPSDGTAFTKTYDGTVDPPSGVNIEFYVKNGSGVERTIPVSSDCYRAIIAYKNKNCSDDNPLTVTVNLTETGTQNYTLGENGTATVTVAGTITQVDPSITLTQTKSDGVCVGDSIFRCLEINAVFPVNVNGNLIYKPIFGPVTPGTDIEVDGESVSISLYRVHPSNITHEWQGQIDFVHDPAMNEELAENSTFTAAGKYYVYAVMESTRNFMRKISGCLVIDVQDTEASSKHHEDYDGSWDGTGTVPIAANQRKSIYLSGSRSTIYTELLLGLKKNLTLCLNGKTLSATNSTTSFDQIRVTGGASLIIDDCTKAGTAKGTVVSSGTGGIAYVQNGSITIRKGKFTGGTAKTGGGAIVVDDGGKLVIEGGEISGNTVTEGSGGAIYIKSGGTVTITNGKIRDNHVYSGNGGAIYVEAGGTLNLYGGTITDNTASGLGGAIYVAAGGTLNLYGGTITGNTASGLGGGIYVEKDGKLNIQRNPVVTNNTANGKASNVYLAQNYQWLSAVNMTAGAKIGISVEAALYPAHFATSTQDYSTYFTPDTEGLSVVYLTAGGLSLVAKPTATLDDNTLTVTTSGGYPDDAVLFVAEYDDSGRMTAVHVQNVPSDAPSYTFTVSSSSIKCFLLRKDTYTPLLEAFSPDSN